MFILENKSPCWERRSETDRLFLEVFFLRKARAPARNADPRHSFFLGMSSQKTKAIARNADPRHTAFLLGMFSPENKSPC